MSHRFAQALAAAALLLTPAAAGAQAPLAPRDVPAKSIPVPATVSPELQAVIAQPPGAGWNTPPSTPEAWSQLVAGGEAALAPTVQPMADRLHVTFAPSTIGGVKVYIVTPDDIPPQNRNRLLVHVHGGCYVLNPHLAALPEALQVAGLSHIKTIAVDYRMPPEAYFPAALDDAMAVYKAASRHGAAGQSRRVRQLRRRRADPRDDAPRQADGLPMPGAIAPGTPMADATKPATPSRPTPSSTTCWSRPTGFCDAATRFYAQGHDLADPMVSPIYGDMHGFPPAILTSGTRDLLLSNTVRTNQKLREAGVETRLQVFEAQSHAQFYRDDRIPEDRFAIGEIAAWFDQHLGH